MSNMFSSNKPRRNETLAQSILLLAVIAAFAQGFHLADGYGELARLALKGAPVTLLALFAVVSSRTGSHLALVFALGFSALGDIMIATDTQHAFISGLAGFLVSHLIYVGMFVKNRDEGHLISKTRYLVVTALWIAGVVGTVLLYPMTGDLGTPVLAYTAALLMMATMAIFSRFNMAVVGVGGLLFVVSDAILGFRHFTSLPENAGSMFAMADWTSHLVWIFYFLGQLLLATGVIFARDKAAFIRGYKI